MIIPDNHNYYGLGWRHIGAGAKFNPNSLLMLHDTPQ